ncbi:hypothetical protein NPIL_252941 [Nephila pilipes]|uniref:Uncharacterized protein n=1 Tax=Nephila pilipes TaxID=299642 RepID=A0A8X6UMS8_NEPPI|nr:hypothetical protein NPIL_252941 [Nephila pilipes]
MRSFLHLSCRVVIKACVTKRDKTYGPLISQEVAREGSHHVKRVITPATLSLLEPSANEGVFVRGTKRTMGRSSIRLVPTWGWQKIVWQGVWGWTGSHDAWRKCLE